MPVPTLSFAIPYYANREYLREAIESVLAQTYDDWELLVVDDRGPEPAADLVASYADPRVRYVVNEENLGLAGNWNECVRLARAEWVTLLHNDDRLLPEYAATVVAATRRVAPDVSVVFTDAAIIGEDGRPTTTPADLAKAVLRGRGGDHDLRGDEGLAPLLRGNYIVCPTMCLRRELVGEAPFSTRWRFVPDWDLTVRQLLAGRALHSVPTPLLEYRRHGGSQTSILTEDASRFVEELTFLEEMAEESARRGWQRSRKAARRRFVTRAHLALQCAADLARWRRAAAREKSGILLRDLRRHHRRGA